MNEIERAAEVIQLAEPSLAMDVGQAIGVAAALADAGLLLTDADRAVLDAAEAWCDNYYPERLDGWQSNNVRVNHGLRNAVRARRQATS